MKLKGVFSLKCKKGYGLSEPGSEEVKYNINDDSDRDCTGNIKGCIVNLFFVFLKCYKTFYYLF